MKNVLKNIDVLGSINQLKYRFKDYNLVAHSLEEFVLRQERFIERVAWRSDLSPKLIKTLIHESTTIMTFATLLGFDITGLKGAAVGAAIGAVIVVGNVVIRIIFVKRPGGIEMEIAA
jgi:hypothetical protein